MANDEPSDFYVEPLRQLTSADEIWLIFKGSFQNCVGVFGDCVDATQQAIRMAEYCVIRGQTAQVHVRSQISMPWQTVWCSTGVIPRFP